MPRTGNPIGRPPGQTFPIKKLIGLTTEQLAAIQAYREAHDLRSDSEAIRVLLSEALAARDRSPAKRRRPKG